MDCFQIIFNFESLIRAGNIENVILCERLDKCMMRAMRKGRVLVYI